MKKILIIDDSMIARKHLKKIVAEHGYEPVVASGGEEGLKLMQDNPPDCILLDQLMPDMEGVEVLARMQELGISVPVVVMTADTQRTTRQVLLEAGARVVLAKPPEPSVLFPAIKDLL